MAEPVAKKQYSGNILEAFLPKAQSKSSSTKSTTTGTDISAEGINEIIRGMMESDSGLANILTGQQSRGLYNSTTASLLANDLAARVAGKAAIAKAPTTVTETFNDRKTDANGKPDKKSSAILEILGQVLNSSGGQKFVSDAFGAVGSGLKNVLGFDGGGSTKEAPVKYETLQMNPYAGSDFSGGNNDYFSTSFLGPKNNFGQDDDEFSLDSLGLGGGGFDFSAGLGIDGFDFSPFTLGDYSLINSGGSSYKDTSSYSGSSFSGGSGVQISGGSNGSSGLSFGFSF